MFQAAFNIGDISLFEVSLICIPSNFSLFPNLDVNLLENPVASQTSLALTWLPVDCEESLSVTRGVLKEPEVLGLFNPKLAITS
jgi:hypothetical protein